MERRSAQPKPDLAQALKYLVQVNIDSADGYRYAAEQLEDVVLAALCDQIALERLAQADELSKFVPFDQELPETSSLSAALTRTWLKIRELLSSDNTYSILSELERSEDYIKQAYEDALDHTVATSASDTIVRQYSQVALAHNRIRDLREQHRAKPR